MTGNELIMLQTQRQADQKHCFACAKLLHVSAQLCPHCGASQSAAHSNGVINQQATGSTVVGGIYCRGCGTAIHIDAINCPKCGVPQNTESQLRKPHKSRVTAGVLAILLGGDRGAQVLSRANMVGDCLFAFMLDICSCNNRFDSRHWLPHQNRC